MPIKMREANISPDTMREYWSYDRETGSFTWLVNRGGHARAGSEAGCLDTRKNGIGHYRMLKLFGIKMMAHRVAWAMHFGRWPKGEIDHLNGDTLDNRISNLRECERAENTKNKRLYKTSKTGIPGVSWRDDFMKWTVRVGNQYIGSYSSLLDAACARKSKESRLGFHENHGQRGVQASKGIG